MTMDDIPISDAASEGEDPLPATKPQPPRRSIGPESETRGGPESLDGPPIERSQKSDG
jgi:hypothetical protein